ncbi:MAG: hypothetical protein AB4426_24305 [Xenococcaceae cyanobacterium]
MPNAPYANAIACASCKCEKLGKRDNSAIADLVGWANGHDF